jgi:riboflavin transporter FmnP
MARGSGEIPEPTVQSGWEKRRLFMNANVKKLTGIAMITAVSFVVMFTSKFEPLAAAPFLSYDAKDVVLMIGGFIYGPLAALASSAIVAMAEMFFRSATGPIGLLMNFISSASYVAIASLVYKKMRTPIGAVAGMLVGSIAMSSTMLLWNYIITPIYMNVPREIVAKMLPTVFLPFNLIKAGLNTAIVLILYKPLITALRAARLLAAGEASSDAPEGGIPVKSKYRVNILMLVIAAALIAACVVAIIILR